MMSEMIVLELPDEVLLKALKQLSPARRQWLLSELATEPWLQLKPVSSETLDAWHGLISNGGDALVESENLYDDPGCT